MMMMMITRMSGFKRMVLKAREIRSLCVKAISKIVIAIVVSRVFCAMCQPRGETGSEKRSEDKGLVRIRHLVRAKKSHLVRERTQDTTHDI